MSQKKYTANLQDLKELYQLGQEFNAVREEFANKYVNQITQYLIQYLTFQKFKLQYNESEETEILDEEIKKLFYSEEYAEDVKKYRDEASKFLGEYPLEDLDPTYNDKDDVFKKFIEAYPDP